jgi:hypothetical protein
MEVRKSNLETLGGQSPSTSSPPHPCSCPLCCVGCLGDRRKEQILNSLEKMFYKLGVWVTGNGSWLKRKGGSLLVLLHGSEVTGYTPLEWYH